ncbi:signal peptidase I [Bacillus sp. FJAT-42376]|uniref:signal peptidase I SipW n=1 Tax=Bacillus sp. FJAT-42376 TaxID=2014076 RepID=UPI000F5113ED|nr:signal peptidase I [Bacillus sp. FJAT-42376]AZB43562.1 signal peptidase I [Bacillus sp. FJAT-42376]
MKIVSRAFTLLLFFILISLAIAVFSSKASGGEPQVFGYQFKTVLSGSMEPGIQTGSVIAVKTGGDMNRFKKDDVITFWMNEYDLATHRITEKTVSRGQAVYRTKGDHNESEDSAPVLSSNVVAEYTGVTIPYAGYISSYAQTKEGRALFAIIPGILLIIYSISTIWQAILKIEENHKKTAS